jgi:hypothetical protein
MNPIGKKVVGLIAVIGVLVAIIVAWHFAHRPKHPLGTTNRNGDQPSSQDVVNFDQFQLDLANRVLKQFGGGRDFSVIVATTAYPLGTLLRPTGSVPADLEDCVPAPPPTPFAAQHLFPSYTMSSDTALAANLGAGALQGLNSAGVKLKQSQNIQYMIADAQIQIMDDKSVEYVTAQGDCGKFISLHPGTRLIRGTVLGKMTYLIKVDNPATVKAQLAKIGGFSINDDPGSSTLSIADNESQPIVLLLSEFGTSRNASVSATTPTPVQVAVPVLHSAPAIPAPPSPGTRPAPIKVGPHMDIQEDATDTREAGTRVVQLLRRGWPTANIESQVQKIPPQNMPNVAQVRYFNASDEVSANRCVDILKQAYPDARAVRIGLPSPKGELEVWLPRKQ